MQRMDARINDEAGAAGLDAYLALFSPAVRAWGLYEDGPADLARVRQHYTPVFGGFKDSILVSEETIVAGTMAAQRYHALFHLDGVFDGVEAHDRLTAIRGQTFFRFDDGGLIAERWSNHDHAYRMGQLQGERGVAEGRRIGRVLNGAGLDEAGVYAALDAGLDAFNRIHSPAQRRAAIARLLDAGLEGDAGSRDALLGRLDAFWRAVPDAVMHLDARLSAWGMGAVRWRIAGSLRGDFEGRAATQQPVSLHGEAIVRFTPAGRIDAVWSGCTHWRAAGNAESPITGAGQRT